MRGKRGRPDAGTAGLRHGFRDRRHVRVDRLRLRRHRRVRGRAARRRGDLPGRAVGISPLSTAHPMLFQQQRGSVLHEVLPSLQPGHG